MKSTFTVKGIVFSALFAALLVVLSYVNLHLGFTPVPIAMETFAVMLAGGILGARYGFFSIALVVVLTALGIPLLHGKGGLPLLTGPTGGFIWAFPFAALFIGLIVPRIKGTNKAVTFILTFLTIEIFGSLLLYVTGVPWLAHVAHYSWPKALTAGFYPYLPGDAIKALVATVITLQVRQLFPVERIHGKPLQPAASKTTAAPL
ncbi:biotin transporter BioY [Paenibacillus sp. MBLB4367]|uniref:biotin transporter BioY n=1 Tax=Paenibacillus sp. MBLB4367 TaxID=3384767 RepID=UPI0039082981